MTTTVQMTPVRRPVPEPKTRAERNIEWCEKHLFLPEGRFAGKKFEMAEFMKEDFRAIYDNPHGDTRRAIITRGRKNAKSVECACIVLLHLCGREYKVNGQLYSTAQSREQAAIIFNLASKMVRMSPKLRDIVDIKESAKELACKPLGTKYKALSADASTAYGLSPTLTVHDELSQVRGPRSELYEALETATAAQEKPLSVIISTQAPTDNDLLSILIDDAKGGHDPKTVLRMNAADMSMDPFSEEAVAAANPALDLFMNKEEVMSMAEAARRMPAREAEFRNLILNQRVEATSPFVRRSSWEACSGAVGNLEEVDIYAGLDLSEVNDLTALVMIGNIAGVWHVRPTFWLPSAGLAQKAKDDRVPYDMWNKQGFLETTPGNSVSYEYVAEYLFKIFQDYNVGKIAFDRWNMRHLKPWLIKAGFDDYTIGDKFVEFGQGRQSMSPALRELESLILEGQIAHGNHPVLNMCAANAVVDGVDASNRKLSKAKSNGRIDGMVALAMAVAVAPLSGEIIDPMSMVA